MPTAPLHFCAAPGCPARVRARYCSAHSRAKREQQSTYSPEARGLYGRAWNKARSTWLGQHPYCQVCGHLANEVDHIRPHRGDRQLFWARENWQSLCTSCHSKKTRAEVITVET